MSKPLRIHVHRWTAQGKVSDLACDLRPDDSVAAATQAIASAMQTPARNVLLWAEVPIRDACAAADVASAIAEDACSADGVVAPASSVLRAYVRRCGFMRKSFQAAVTAMAVLTFSRATQVVSTELVASRASVARPLGSAAGIGRHPNPFLPDSSSGSDPDSPHQAIPVPQGAAATLESYRVADGIMTLHAVALDDALAHFRRSGQPAESARAWFLDAYGPEPNVNYLTDTSDIGSNPQPSKSWSGATTPSGSDFVVRSLHLEVARVRWLVMRPATTLFAGTIATAFANTIVSNAIPLVRLTMGGQVKTRMLRRGQEPKWRSTVAGLLKRGALRTGDVAQLALFSLRDNAEWCVTLSIEGNSKNPSMNPARLDVYMSHGSLLMGDVAAELDATVRGSMLPTLWHALGWGTVPCTLDAAAWGRRTAHDDGSSQRLVAATLFAALTFESVTPTAASVRTALSAELPAHVANVEEVGGVVVCQYRRVYGYTPITPEQQAVRLNAAVPTQILANSIVERYGLTPQAAQQLVEEETRKREFLALHQQQTFLLIKMSPATSIMTVTMRGITDTNAPPRILDAIREANIGVALPTTASLTAITQSDAFQDFFDDNDVPDELRAALEDAATPTNSDATERNSSRATTPEVAHVKGDRGDDVPGRFLISELHRADPKLFDTGDKHTRYSRICAKNMLRQPIRVSPAELTRIQKEFPGAAASAAVTGSSREASAANRYICPKVWCPKSRMALTLEQFESLGRKCPYDAVHEEPLVFDGPTYWRGRERHPGFLDPKFHPDGICMPCCFLKPGRKTGRCRGASVIAGSAASSESRNPGVPDQKDEATSNARYIYGESTTLSQGRYGMLPARLHGIFNSGTRCIALNTAHLTTRTTCVLRKGMSAGQYNMYDCLAAVLELGVEGRRVPELVRENLDVQTFLALHDGRLAQLLVPSDLSLAAADPVRVMSFASWLAARDDKDIERFGLANVIAYVSKLKGGSLPMPRDQKVSTVALQALREFALFMALQAYLDIVEAARSHDWILDLVNLAPQWINPHRRYLLVLTCRALLEDPVLACPSSRGATVRADRVAIVLRHGARYEALTTVFGVRGGIKEAFAFDAERVPAVRTMLDEMSRTCAGAEAADEAALGHRVATVVRGLELLGERVEVQVLNYALQCVGLVTASGVFVPLPSPDALLLDRGIPHVAFVEEAIQGIRTLDPKHVGRLMQRLSAVLGTPAFDVLRAIPGGLLLRMGKAVPLAPNDSLLQRYASDVSVFLDTGVVDDPRVTHMRTIDARSKDLDAARRAFLVAMQEDPVVLRNMAAVVSAGCRLPFDVRHRYLASLVRRFAREPLQTGMEEELADALLLGIDRRAHAGPVASHYILTFDGTEPPAVLEQTAEVDPLTRCPPPPATVRWNAAEDVALRQLVPPALLGVIDDGGQSHSRSRSPSHSYRSRARASRASRGTRILRTTSSRNSVRMEVLPVPLASVDVAVKLVRYVDGVVHIHAPLPETLLTALVPPKSTPLDALLTLFRVLDLPVALLNPLAGSINTPASSELALVIALRASGTHDALLTRRITRNGKELFGALTRVKDLGLDI